MPARIEEIRGIYRETSVYFVAFRESFGLPVCELQACGAYVFTPYAKWVPSHWTKPDLMVKGEGTSPGNFIVYGNDLGRLKEELVRIREIYDPDVVFRRFLQDHPQFYHGNLDELRSFVSKVSERTIHSRSHLEYECTNEQIQEVLLTAD